MQIQKHGAEINGQQLRYLLAGSGPPVVLVHGLLGGSFCWRFNIWTLCPSGTLPWPWTCLALARTTRLATWIAAWKPRRIRLAGLLEKLKLENGGRGGASWGGAVAIFLAAMSTESAFPGAGGAGESLVRLWRRAHTLSERPAGRNTASPDAWPVSRPLHRTAVRAHVWRSRAHSAGNNRGLFMAC